MIGKLNHVAIVVPDLAAASEVYRSTLGATVSEPVDLPDHGVTTVFVEETGVEVNKPEAAAAVQLEKNSILIAVTSDNKVIYGGRDIGVGGVSPIVKRLTLQEDIPVIIQADAGANHGIFARVYGEAKLAGAKSINFSTKR